MFSTLFKLFFHIRRFSKCLPRCFQSRLLQICCTLERGVNRSLFQNIYYMSLSTRKPTVCSLCKVLTNLSMPHRLTLIDRHISPPVDFLFQESVLYTSFSQRRNHRPGLAYADSAGRSGLMHYAEAIMFVFSRRAGHLYLTHSQS